MLPRSDLPIIRARLATLVEHGQELESEGLPFPTQQLSDTVDHALKLGQFDEAAAFLKRGETLYRRTSENWGWVRDLLRKVDDLHSIAGAIGMDVQHLDARVGNARLQLQSQPLSSTSLDKAAASASLALAVLNETIPAFCVQEAQRLGESIKRARDRGEEVSGATRAFSDFLGALQDDAPLQSAQKVLELRKAVSKIPRAPVLPPLSPVEEEEILLEARNLARRLQRIRGRAKDAPSAARLMTQVRAALSEDRRYGTPEEEVEALWREVDRLTREKQAEITGERLTTEEGPPEVDPDLLLAANEPLEPDFDSIPLPRRPRINRGGSP